VGAKPRRHAVVTDDAQSVFQFLVLARLEQIVRHAAVVVDGAELVLQHLTDMPLKAAEFRTGHAHIAAQQHGIDAVFATAGKRILDAGGGESILHLPIHFLTEMGVSAERISADDESVNLCTAYLNGRQHMYHPL